LQLQSGGRSRRDENGRDYIRWCFADAETAEAFAVRLVARCHFLARVTGSQNPFRRFCDLDGEVFARPGGLTKSAGAFLPEKSVFL
jgi:hypothetical protein